MWRVLFTLGGPGSGKGTQCRLLAAALHMQHLSAGELLRRAVVTGSPQAPTITACLDQGSIVPAQITIALLRSEMQRLGSVPVYLIDGFPRNKDNFDQWFSTVTEAKIAGVLHFQVPDAELRRRLLARKEGRSDDTPAGIEKRIATYHHDTTQALTLFSARSIPVINVNGEGEVREVSARAQVAVQRALGVGSIIEAH